MCSSGIPNIYWSDTPVLQQLCKLSQMLSHPIFGACILFFFFFGSGRSRLGTACSVTDGCAGLSLSLLPAHTQARSPRRWMAGDLLPSWLFTPRCPTASNTGTSNCFSDVNSELPAGDKNIPYGDTEIFQ